ncbi:hypothetical protein NDS46_05875 [Paenibacillus thiaminolyticus]|uniref:hypothetical protein n=1 Tax=Paenibacillus thiaminolyticus TaxID=49283 RepID=UPI00232AE095|nr:hypothetical protein [Paenibacillus thiaminolyticus]WCF09424.1 hypothetical protein NDS46_05875 [Paenibacillus thiaminolyticus]
MYSATEVESLIFCRPRLLVDLALHDGIDEVDRFCAVIDAAGTASLLVGRQQRIGHIHIAFGGGIRSGCGLNMWREIAAVLQDSLSGKVVQIKLLYWRRISLTE